MPNRRPRPPKVVPLPRRHRRFPCSAAVELEDAGALHQGRCENLSVGGAFVAGLELPLGWVGDVTLFLARGSVRVTAEICSSRPARSAGRGLRFLRLDPAALATLCSFLHEQLSVPRRATRSPEPA